MIKRYISLIIVVLLLLLSGCENIVNNNKDSFPSKDLNGVIQWGAGGGTDIISRSLTPFVEQNLGKSIILQNKTGATGAIATQFVHDQASDGYNLLYGAENPQLYQVMGISQLSYDDFEPIILIGRETAVVVVREDSKYKSIEELLLDAKSNPDKIKMGTTGPGGLPFVVASLFKSVDEVTFNQIPFDGDGPVVTALLGGHVDFTITKLSAVKELLRNEDVRVISSISNDNIPGYEEVEPIGVVRDEYSKYLPWGPFYGVYVKKDTPKEIVDVLVKAYKEAYDRDEFQIFMSDNAIIPMGISGEEAYEFLDAWKRVSSWLLFDAGGTEISPEEFDIKRIVE